MPRQLELPFPKDESDDFDSPYLDMRVALNTLEQLDFSAERQSLTMYRDQVAIAKGRAAIHATIGWSTELADPRDKDIFAQLIEDGGWPISRMGADATIHTGKLSLTLRGAFPNPGAIGKRRPTIEDLYPTTSFGERGARGRLNPVMDSVLKSWHREDW